MKTPMVFVDVAAPKPVGRPLRFSGLGGALSHAARFLRSLFGGSGTAGSAGPPPGEAAALSLASVAFRGRLAFEYPVFRPTYLARPTEEPEEVPDQPDPPPSSGSRLQTEEEHRARLLQVLRNIFDGLLPGDGLPRWEG